MKYALIGCGRISTNHMKAAIDNKLEIVAVCDVIPERMEALLEKHSLNHASIARYTDYEQLLREQKPELVAIATESGNHATIALDCLNAGSPVIIEKPIALSLADADAIIARGKEKGLAVCACHQNRFNVAVQHIRDAKEAGRFGRLSHGAIHVRWCRDAEYYRQSPWRGTWKDDGGALMNQSIHGIDLLRWMMEDEIQEVFAYTARQFHPYIQAEDIGMAVVKFANGAIGTIEGTTNVFPRNLEETLYLFGESGTVKAGGRSVNSIDVWQFADEQPGDSKIQAGIVEETENVYGNGHGRLYADMIEAIEQKRAPYVDGKAGKRALELVLAVYKSAATGKPVQFPLVDCATMDFVGRF